MKEIPLTQGQVALVDDQDYDLVIKWKWCAHKSNGGFTFYAAAWNPVSRIGEPRFVRMHRVILGLSNPKVLVDHRDRNGLNNQRSNLRIVDPSANARNRSKQRNTLSRYRGVTKCGHRFRAYIVPDGRFRSLGCYSTQEDAARAYDLAAAKFFGEFANLNFPPKKAVVASEVVSRSLYPRLTETPARIAA